jgi:hypothetical protein
MRLRTIPILVLGAILGMALVAQPLQGQTTEPPDTVQVDSTRLRIFNQLEELAKPPGIDSTWFVPDSLLSDSALAERDARMGRGPSRPIRSQGIGAADSIMGALMELEGYSLTQYSSQGADFGAKTKQLVLTGTPQSRPRLIREGEEITADSALIYSDEQGKVWSVGNDAIYQPKEGDPINSARIVFDLNETRGTAMNARTRYTSGTEWILYSEYLTVEDEAAYGHKVMFTSCEEEEPHYHFAADNIKILNDNMMVARPVKLYFADVPVAWLPFIVQSTETGRASGLLTPIFSINDIVRTSQSYSRRLSNIGFYWAMNDYMDASLAMDWWSGEHTSLTGSYQFAWSKQFLNGGVNYRKFWREEGGTETAFDVRGDWQMNERTSTRFSARYASSNDFVRRTSFDPQEVVQSINSEGGISRRFDFGNLSLSGNRRQYLSDDRVDMTLPTASFSLSPITFLRAAPSQARFYNNMTWSGSAKYSRRTSDRLEQADSAWSAGGADSENTTAGFSSSLNLGNLSVSSGVDMKEGIVKGVPLGLDSLSMMALGYEDQSQADVTWNASLNYQQHLIGSTTITPALRISGNMMRSDTDSLAQNFVSAPSRLSFGASLKTDIFGFFPGVGPFEAIRHKISPGFDFDYAPGVNATPLQEDVFGSRSVGTQRVLKLNLNQTFEAKLKDEEVAERAAQLDSVRVDSLTVIGDSLRNVARDLPNDPLDMEVQRVDSLIAEIDSLLADTTAEFASQQEAQKVTLLALRTSAMTYDFEQAKEDGEFLRGFETTRLTNNISSDYLRGLSVTVTHDLFVDDAQGAPDGGEGEASGPSRSFAPHLSNMNLGFSLSSQSWVFKTLGALFRRAQPEEEESVVDAGGEEEDPGAAFATPAGDEASIVPTSDPPPRAGPRGGGAGRVGEWRANLSYSLQRPRDEDRPSNQMLSSTLNFTPTEKWEVSWRTSYDLNASSFNDHYIRLTRDLHRWEAYFDFRQTATGNWSFRFEVALTDQSDLNFDYVQRSMKDSSGREIF